MTDLLDQIPQVCCHDRDCGYYPMCRCGTLEDCAEEIERLGKVVDKLGDTTPMVCRGVSYICYDAMELKARIQYARDNRKPDTEQNND